MAPTYTQLNDGSGSDRQFQHHNTLFSIFAVTDETGAVLERYQYDPYGNQTVMDANFDVLTDSTIGQEFSYTGQRFDDETDYSIIRTDITVANKDGSFREIRSNIKQGQIFTHM